MFSVVHDHETSALEGVCLYMDEDASSNAKLARMSCKTIPNVELVEELTSSGLVAHFALQRQYS